MMEQSVVKFYLSLNRIQISLGVPFLLRYCGYLKKIMCSRFTPRFHLYISISNTQFIATSPASLQWILLYICPFFGLDGGWRINMSLFLQSQNFQRLSNLIFFALTYIGPKQKRAHYHRNTSFQLNSQTTVAYGPLQ